MLSSWLKAERGFKCNHFIAQTSLLHTTALSAVPGQSKFPSSQMLVSPSPFLPTVAPHAMLHTIITSFLQNATFIDVPPLLKRQQRPRPPHHAAESQSHCITPGEEDPCPHLGSSFATLPLRHISPFWKVLPFHYPNSFQTNHESISFSVPHSKVRSTIGTSSQPSLTLCLTWADASLEEHLPFRSQSFLHFPKGLGGGSKTEVSAQLQRAFVHKQGEGAHVTQDRVSLAPRPRLSEGP